METSKTSVTYKELQAQSWDIIAGYDECPNYLVRIGAVASVGLVGIMVVKTPQGSDCYNYHPMRKGFTKTHSLPYFRPLQQFRETEAAIKRLFIGDN